MNVEYGNKAETAFSGDISAKSFTSVRFEQIEVNIRKLSVPKKALSNSNVIASSNNTITKKTTISKDPSTDNLVSQKSIESKKDTFEKREIKDKLDIRTSILQSGSARSIVITKSKGNTGALSPFDVNFSKKLNWAIDEANSISSIIEAKKSNSSIEDNLDSDYSQNSINLLHFSKVV